MQLKHSIIAGTASLVILGGLVFHDKWLPDEPPSAASGPELPGGGAATVHPAAATMPKSPVPAANAEETRPVWLNPPVAAVPAGPAPISAERREEEARAARLQAAVTRLGKLQADPQVDPASVDEALAEVERANGSSVLRGVRLDVLRENLKVAARMQKAAEDLQALQQREVAPDRRAQHEAELNKKLADIESLQRELRMDFFVSNGTAVKP